MVRKGVHIGKERCTYGKERCTYPVCMPLFTRVSECLKHIKRYKNNKKGSCLKFEIFP